MLEKWTTQIKHEISMKYIYIFMIPIYIYDTSMKYHVYIYDRFFSFRSVYQSLQ